MTRSDKIRPGLVDVGALAQRLNADIAAVVAELRLAGRREGHEFVALNPTRADRRLGSFRINLYGAKQGIWADFAVAGAKGDALDLVAYVAFAGDKRAAIQWAKRRCGLEDGGAVPPPAARPRAQEVKSKPYDPNPNKGAAQRIWLEGRRLIRGTPVEMYLRGRGIDFAALQRTPGSLRYHPALANPENDVAYPAMVAAVQDGDGRFVACHRTWLKVHDPGAEASGAPHPGAEVSGAPQRVTKAPLTDPKRTLGRYAGGLIPIWRGASGQPIKSAPPGDTVAITEGIEDALTVALAAPELRVVCAVSLANMAGVPLPAAIADVILVGDNDPGRQAQDLLMRAVAAHRAAGRTVRIAYAGGGCKDVNERLLQGAAQSEGVPA